MEASEALRTLEEELERGAASFASAGSLDQLERAHTDLLGRKSKWSEVQRSLGDLQPEERRTVGKRANEDHAQYEQQPAIQADVELGAGQHEDRPVPEIHAI